MEVFYKIAPIAKAVTAAIIAGLTAVLTGLGDGSISWYEIIAAIIAFFTGLIAVFSIPNKPSVSG